jgi:hypothetical protein
LLDAFVNRMVAFDLPEVAYQQAQTLISMDPNNGQAWAVVAYGSVRRGQMNEALADLVQAASREPDNTFVQSTAGQLLAWYDKYQPAVSDSLKNSLEQVRRNMAGEKAYADAYKQAGAELQRGAGTQQIAPAAQPYIGSTYWASPLYPDMGIDYSSLYSQYYPLCPQAICYPGYYPFYYYPSLAYADWCWWPYGPFYGSGFFFGFHNRFFDHDDFFHHGFGFDGFRHHGIFAFDHRGRSGDDARASAFRGNRDAFGRDSSLFGSTHTASALRLSGVGGSNRMSSERLGLTSAGWANGGLARGSGTNSLGLRGSYQSFSRGTTSISPFSGSYSARGFAGGAPMRTFASRGSFGRFGGGTFTHSMGGGWHSSGFSSGGFRGGGFHGGGFGGGGHGGGHR